jgi:hypothetical protein
MEWSELLTHLNQFNCLKKFNVNFRGYWAKATEFGRSILRQGIPAVKTSIGETPVMDFRIGLENEPPYADDMIAKLKARCNQDSNGLLAEIRRQEQECREDIRCKFDTS